jgi:DNA-binding beta-propeller fold protein YncE
VPNVFISYRRDDTSGYARSLYDRLNERWPGEVFMDVDAIPLGRDFVEVITERLQVSDTMLVLIGPEWLTASDAHGNRRLDDEGDLVRAEVAAALRRNASVVPVLLQGAAMPTAAELPPDLRPLSRRQCHELRHSRWDDDVERLETAIGPARQRPRRALLLGSIALVVAAAAVAGIALLAGSGDKDGPGREASRASRPATTVVPVGSEPKGVAVAGNSVWVVNSGDGSVQQIDAAQRAAVGQPIEIGGPGAYIAADERWVWASVIGDGSEPGYVVQVDADAGEAVGPPIPAGRFPQGILITGKSLWVADYGGTLQRFESDTGARTDVIPIKGSARTIAAAAGKIWIPDLHNGVVRVLDMATRKLLPTAIPVGREPTAIVAAGDHVWVADNRLDNVSRIDVNRMEVVGRPTPVGREPAEIAAGQGAIWVLNEGDQSVTRIDPRTARATGTPIKVGRDPGGLAAGAGAIWVPNADDDTVTRIAPPAS